LSRGGFQKEERGGTLISDFELGNASADQTSYAFGQFLAPVQWGENDPAEEGLTTLVEAHGCFRGILRALAEDDRGDHVVAFILKPKFYYKRVTNLVCRAAKRVTPDDLVYVVHGRLDVPLDPKCATIGVITHGGFVVTDRFDPVLPEDHSTRYVERLW
jgi:hypothetical protein